jgi:hypothetical protein
MPERHWNGSPEGRHRATLHEITEEIGAADEDRAVCIRVVSASLLLVSVGVAGDPKGMPTAG